MSWLCCSLFARSWWRNPLNLRMCCPTRLRMAASWWSRFGWGGEGSRSEMSSQPVRWPAARSPRRSIPPGAEHSDKETAPKPDGATSDHQGLLTMPEIEELGDRAQECLGKQWMRVKPKAMLDLVVKAHHAFLGPPGTVARKYRQDPL